MKKNIDLEKDSIAKLFLHFVIPTTISLIVISLYTIADGVFISRGVGSAGIAAVNIAYPLLNFTIALSLMFGIGGSTLIAFKKENIDFQNKCFSHIILLNIFSYIIIAAIVIIFTDKLMFLFGSNEELLPLVKKYLYPCLFSAFFLMISCSLNTVVRNDNAPNRVLIATLIGACLNIILDYIFIFKLNFGISGGSYATAISQIISATYLCLHFVNSSFRFNFYFKKIDFKLLIQILKIGFPSFILEFSVAIITIILNISFMNNLGTFGVSAYSIVSYSFMIFRMIFTGISQGIQPLISYNFAKRNFKRSRMFYSLTKKVSFIASIIAIIFVFFFSKYIIFIFTNEAAIIKEASKGFILYSIALVFLSFNFVNISYFQAINNIKISNIICISRSFVFVFLGLIVLTRVFGSDGIWLALPFSDTITALISLLFLKNNLYNYKKIPSTL